MISFVAAFTVFSEPQIFPVDADASSAELLACSIELSLFLVMVKSDS
jgi:hypothetical protein